MLPYRHMVLHWSKTAMLTQFSKCLSTASSCRPLNVFLKSTSIFSLHKCEGQPNSIHGQKKFPTSLIHTMNHPLLSKSPQSEQEREKMALISSQMNMRLLNENSFLSWCRNAYLSSVVGIAMMEEATSMLAQTAGFGAFLVGGMNVFWGTGCHVTNLVKLRHISGMSSFTLFLHILGSMVHCCLWLFILTCYIGFLDDPNYKKTLDVENTDTDRN